MATAVNLKTTGRSRSCSVLHHGVTLRTDICSIRLSDELFDRSKVIVKDLKTNEAEEIYLFTASEEQIKVYDLFKRFLGFENGFKASKAMDFSDTVGNHIKLKGPFKKKQLTSVVKYAVVKNRQVPISTSTVRLSELAKTKLKEVGYLFDIADSRASQSAKYFMQLFGSHFQSGMLEHGGVFEWVVTWESQPQADANKDEKLANEVLKACQDFKGSDTGFLYKSPDVEHNKFKGLKDLTVRITTFGGKKGNIGFTEWKEDMKNATGDKILVGGAELDPIWKLVEQDKMNYCKKNGFVDFLKSTWTNHVRTISPRDKLIEILGLLQYQERGISLEEVRALALCSEDQTKKREALTDIPWKILEKWMRLDYRCREFSTIRQTLKDNKEQVQGMPPMHMMDIALLIFMSCDMLLRQVLVQKLAPCRLAIPFLIPDIGDGLKLSIWPMRAVCLGWTSTSGDSIEVSLAKHPFKLVSFVRIGEVSQSKSRLLNDIMCNTAKDTFFHREAGGGTNKRLVANGLVEMSYFLPQKGNSQQNFTEEILFLNLRGDGRLFERQLKLMSKISSVVVCMVEISSFQEDPLVLLSAIRQSCKETIVLLIGKKSDNSDTEEDVCQQLDQDGYKVVKGYEADFEIAPRPAADLAGEVIPEIAKALSSEGVLSSSILDKLDFFHSQNVIIDETHAECCKSSGKVEVLLEEVKSMDIATAKTQLLKLQGQDLKDWTQVLKKKHRRIKDLTAEESMKEKGSLDEEMYKLRESQLAEAKQLKPILKQFIDAQQRETHTMDKNGYFKLLKIELDDISRSIMPELRQKYKAMLQEKNADDLRKLEKQMDESSFGPEHLFREIGQLYECLKECKATMSKEHEKIYEQLPSLAAKYFLAGHPLEIMDGDASVVPLVWLKAVLNSLHGLIGDKTMFVLSVIGVQSSGKSTLLNTMFGLELAVGAGRCTRGIYAQLLPVNQSQTRLPVDFILVLDSEGLCGTDSGSSREHDNEIATLVIGLADMTIVNIKGENYQQMKEILEIAVHSFLRMTVAYKKQKCIFLHHSVPAMDVPRLLRDRTALQSGLDEMTRLAAENENRAGTINKFHHVIEFNAVSDQDVFCIPHLWLGVPPMGQVSPGYSDHIKTIRNVVLKEIEISERCVTAKNLQIRLEDMWNGVLSDDFLFSFRNNLSVKAYLEVEMKFYKLKRQVESTLLEHVDKESKLGVEKCDTEENLKLSFNAENLKLDEKVHEVSKNCEEEFETFFKESNLREHLIPLKNLKINEFKHVATEIGRHIAKDLKYYVDCKRLEIEQTFAEKRTIVEKANTLAVKLRGSQVEDKELEQHFNTMWQDWRSNLHLDQVTNVVDAYLGVKAVSEEVFATQGHLKFLKPVMEKNFGLSKPVKDMIEESDMVKEYLANKDFPKSQTDVAKHWKGTDLVPKQRPRKEYFPVVVKETNTILNHTQRMLEDMNETNLKFHPSLAHKILQHVLQEIRRINNLPYDSATFTLTPEFVAMISVQVAQLAAKKFEELNAKFVETFSIEAKLKSFRETLRNLFINLVHEKVNEGAAEFLCDQLTAQIPKHIHKDMTRTAVDKLLATVSHSKHKLLIEVLKTLMKNDTFADYMVFINDVFGYCSNWVENRCNVIFFDGTSDCTEYGKLAVEQLQLTMHGIREGLKTALEEARVGPEEQFQMEKFVDVLKVKLRQSISLTESDFKVITNMKQVNSETFLEVAMTKLQRMEDKHAEDFRKASAASNPPWDGQQPHKIVMDKVWGCKASCPICLSPCFYTTPNHLKDGKNHECNQHWPEGIGGVRWTTTNKLSSDICSFSITTESKFRCSACRKQCRNSGKCSAEGDDFESHSYTDYQTFLPQWSIERDIAGNESKYWQRVMHKFQTDLARHHNAINPDVPGGWKLITKEHALESLDKLSDKSISK